MNEKCEDEGGTMTNLFNIDLTINMPDGGRNARQLLNTYLADMPADITEIAITECEANQSVPARKFDNLTLKRSEVWSNPEHSLKIFVLLSVDGEHPAFVKGVITKYMENFPDYLKKASVRYFSRIDLLPDSSLQATDWKAEIK